MSHQSPFPEQPRKPVASPPQALTEPSPEELLLRAQAEELERLLQSPGWGVLSRIFASVMEQAAKEADEGEGVSVYRAQGKKMALRQINSMVNQFIDTLKEEKDDGKEEG